jgi:hypothetical protein
MRRRRGQAAQGGYSLIELMLVVGMAGITIAAITRFAFRTRVDLLRQEDAGELALRNNRISQNLQATIKTAQLALVNGGADFSALRAYVLNSLAATGAPKPASFSNPLTASTDREPYLSGTAAAGTLATGMWGDELMLITSAGPVSFTAYSGSCTEVVSADRLQFVYIYLGKAPGTALPNGSPALRLVEWRSQPVVAFQSISAYVGTNSCASRLTSVAAALVTAGYNLAFDVASPSPMTSPSSGAFYQVLSPTAGNGYNAWASYNVTPPLLAESSWAYMDDFDYVQAYNCRPGLDRGRVSRGLTQGSITAPSTFSMAYNTTSSNAAFKVGSLEAPGGNITVPKFAPADELGPGFPGGFEVSMVGESKAREFYIRHVLMVAGALRANSTVQAYMAHEKCDDIAVHLVQ